MEHLKLAVNGAGGRMGKRIIALAREAGGFDIVAALEQPQYSHLNADAGLVAGVGELGVKVTTALDADVDVMIDFSHSGGTLACAEMAKVDGFALVVGTTGLSTAERDKLHDISGEAPVLVGSNMSLGVNLLFRLVAQVAKRLDDGYDIEIVEAHHRFKKDSPSGTALELARQIAKAKEWDWPACLVNGREGKEALRQEKTIGMHAVRLGDTIGEHSVFFGALGETIELRHTAHNRDTFARGSLHAAKWLAVQKPGFYSMFDVLGL